MSVPSGQVYLVKNAIVDPNYNHTIDFKSPEEQQAYWGSLVSESFDKYSYIRRTSQILKVERSLDELQEVNYLFFRSGKDLKLYYCFVTNKEYGNDKMTYITFEVDVLQTRMFEYKLNQSYVLQEHCDRWDADHKPIYSRTDEGLDYGSEYTVEQAFKIKSDKKTQVRWYLAVCKQHSELVSSGHNAIEPTTIQGSANPFIFYLLPGDDTQPFAGGDQYTFKYKGGDIDVSANVNGVVTFTALMNASALGEYVQQIIKLPYLPFDVAVNEDGDAFDFSSDDAIFNTTSIENYNFIRLIAAANTQRLLAEMGIFDGIESAIPTEKQWAEIKANPYTTERDRRFESKLLCHPYRYNLLTDWKSQPVVYKNEHIAGDKIRIGHVQTISATAPARYWLTNYKKDPEGRNNAVVQAVQEDSPVISDAYYSYMLANRNQLQADRTNATINAVSGTVKGAVGGGLLSGNWIGAIAGAASSAVDGALNYQGLVRSQNAVQSDIKNLPDTINSSNDSSFNIQDKNEFLTFYRMKICCEFEELLADTFNMTGYTVKRVKKPNLRSRARFNYIKTVGANVVGNFDQNDIRVLKQIFDNGVTFWHYNKDHFRPFDYGLENIETKLI